MATDKPPIVTVNTGGNTEGWSKGEITGLCLAVIAALTLILGISTCVWKCWQAKKEKQSLKSKKAGDNPELWSLTHHSGTSTGTAVASEPKTNVSYHIPNPPAKITTGCGGRQASYAICLVSISIQTPDVDKIMNMCRKSGWKFTTSFDSKLGEPAMQSVQEAAQACPYNVFLVNKDDCLKEKKDFNKTIEMPLESKKNRKMGGNVPIRCSDEVALRLLLVCLEGSTIGEDDLEERMIKIIDKRIRREREAQCQSVSGAPGVRDGADEEDGADETDGADDRDGADRRDGADVAGGSDNASAACSGKTVLTDIYFMELAGQSGSDREDLVSRYILQCVQQITPIKNDREMVEELCHDLTKYGRDDLSIRVKS